LLPIGLAGVSAAFVLAVVVLVVSGAMSGSSSFEPEGEVAVETTAAEDITDVAGAAQEPGLAGVRLWSNGDSTSFYMSVELASSMAAAGATLTQPEAEYKNSSGLITREFFDWPAYIQSEMEARNPNLAVFMIGANDAKFLGDPEAYRGMVGEAMDLFKAPERRLVWVGQPNSSQEKLAVNLPTINRIFQEEASKRPWVTFVDTWAVTSDADGKYSQMLPDAGGEMVKAREDDGVHLTQPGGRILADVVLGAIAALYSE
jgi:hypothetical protein